jgi:hypothetical protein
LSAGSFGPRADDDRSRDPRHEATPDHRRAARLTIGDGFRVGLSSLAQAVESGTLRQDEVQVSPNLAFYAQLGRAPHDILPSARVLMPSVAPRALNGCDEDHSDADLAGEAAAD